MIQGPSFVVPVALLVLSSGALRTGILPSGVLSSGVVSSVVLSSGVLPRRVEVGAQRGEGQDEAPVDLDARYRLVSLPLGPLDGEPWEGQPGMREFVLRLGRFEAAQVGESVELMALRLGVEPSLIQLSHGLPAGHGLAGGEPICVELHHLVLPDERLAPLAELHGCSVETLRLLNGLEEDEQPRPWSMLRVPARFGPPRAAGAPASLRVVYPQVEDVIGDGAPIRLSSGRRCEHLVVDGDSFESIGALHGVPADELRFGHRFLQRPAVPADLELARGEKVVVFVELEVDREASLIEVVTNAQYICWDFPQLLRLNQIERPEDLQGRELLRFPLNLSTLQFSSGSSRVLPRPR